MSLLHTYGYAVSPPSVFKLKGVCLHEIEALLWAGGTWSAFTVLDPYATFCLQSDY